jgi:hypothetical protein
VLVSGAQIASANTLKTFSVAGTYKWVVPAGVTSVLFDVFGASGGDIVLNGVTEAKGGTGGEAKGRFRVQAGQIFEIVVGGHKPTQNGGGFNGGGSPETNGPIVYKANGGGGSDVRIGGKGNSCASTKVCTYFDRIIVAGGGGGASLYVLGGNGGPGGGLKGGSASSQSHGGGQEQLYAGGCAPTLPIGCFGQGGGAVEGENEARAGGGGGWFGGDASNPGSNDIGGSGGSGYVSPLASSPSFPGGTNRGDGMVIIKS